MAAHNGKPTEPIVFFDRILELPHYQHQSLLAFPRNQTVADFELFTGKDLNCMVNRAAKHYHHEAGLKPDQVEQHKKYYKDFHADASSNPVQQYCYSDRSI